MVVFPGWRRRSCSIGEAWQGGCKARGFKAIIRNFAVACPGCGAIWRCRAVALPCLARARPEFTTLREAKRDHDAKPLLRQTERAPGRPGNHSLRLGAPPSRPR